MNNHYAYFNHLTFQLPIEAIYDCSHQGQCFPEVEFWQGQLNLNLDKDAMISELKEYGAWENLHDMSHEELEQKIIWIAACNIREELENNENQ
jgi:hypothetical protein